jgi:hypothetical protein
MGCQHLNGTNFFSRKIIIYSEWKIYSMYPTVGFDMIIFRRDNIAWKRKQRVECLNARTLLRIAILICKRSIMNCK